MSMVQTYKNNCDLKENHLDFCFGWHSTNLGGIFLKTKLGGIFLKVFDFFIKPITLEIHKLIDKNLKLL